MAARNIYPAHGQDEYMAMRTVRANEAARVAASKPLTSLEFAQKKAAEALARLANDEAPTPSVLAPVKHPQKDFFIADIVDTAVKDDMASMEHPLFALKAW